MKYKHSSEKIRSETPVLENYQENPITEAYLARSALKNRLAQTKTTFGEMKNIKKI